MNANYYLSAPSAYADRAANLLESSDSAHLFYAALEIRLGVEARMQAYAQASINTSAALKEGWKIARLAKGLDKAFKGVKDVVEMSISNSRQEPPFAVLHYTPVCAELQKLTQRLGNYLHYRDIGTDGDEPWWTQFRSHVRRAQVLLSFACLGQMLGPPLWNPVTGEMRMNAEFKVGDPIVDRMRQLAHTRLEMAFNVSYIPVEEFYVRD